MIILHDKLQKQLQILDKKPWHLRLALCLAILFLFVVFWFNAIHASLQFRQQETQNKLLQIQTKTIQTQQQLDAIHTTLASNVTDPLAKEQQSLQQELKNIDNVLQQHYVNAISTSDILSLLNHHALESHIQLSKLTNTTAVSPDLLAAWPFLKEKKLIQKAFTVVFAGNYFSTIDYLERLEKQAWPLIATQISYQVEQYPRASVNLTLYFLTHDDLQHSSWPVPPGNPGEPS